jgi:hypothetical protein
MTSACHSRRTNGGHWHAISRSSVRTATNFFQRSIVVERRLPSHLVQPETPESKGSKFRGQSKRKRPAETFTCAHHAGNRPPAAIGKPDRRAMALSGRKALKGRRAREISAVTPLPRPVLLCHAVCSRLPSTLTGIGCLLKRMLRTIPARRLRRTNVMRKESMTA